MIDRPLLILLMLCCSAIQVGCGSKSHPQTPSSTQSPAVSSGHLDEREKLEFLKSLKAVRQALSELQRFDESAAQKLHDNDTARASRLKAISEMLSAVNSLEDSVNAVGTPKEPTGTVVKEQFGAIEKKGQEIFDAYETLRQDPTAKTPKELSLAHLSSIRAAFATLLRLNTQASLSFVGNELLHKEHVRIRDEQRAVLEAEFQPEGFSVIDWPGWVNSVKENGTIVELEVTFVDTKITVKKIRNDIEIWKFGRVSGVFRDVDNQFRGVLSKINTRRAVKVKGRYSGKFKRVQDEENPGAPQYVLDFVLDGIEISDEPYDYFIEAR